MSDCTIFNKTLILDANLNSSDIEIDLSKIRNLLGEFDAAKSGLWQPIIIYKTNSSAQYCQPLIMAGLGASSVFNPCNCSDSELDTEKVDQLGAFQDSSLSCDYCGEFAPTPWNLIDNQGELSPDLQAHGCCSGACDTRMKRDDYLPKIPVLNQSYMTGFLDFKYMSQFPACDNPGLGFERFITIPANNMGSVAGADLCIDWKLKETISEIPYNKIYSQHHSQYDHDKSYTKAHLVSQTCGNFILTRINPDYETEYVSKFPSLTGLIGSTDSNRRISLPSVDNFQQTPYGFDKQTYNNIYVNNNRIASYWKWNYTSGIIGWYRYFDRNRTNDQRPIKGVDLYISPGDVFFATNDGPEPVSSSSKNSFIKTCPSGLKAVSNNQLDCIIPSGSEFIYISANIYSQFFSIYNTLLSTNSNDTVKTIQQAALLATAPQYDKVTVDLSKYSLLTDYQRNELNQIDVFNKDMSTGTSYDSLSHLYFISNKTELINTLANKYGSYLWIEPNSTNKEIVFKIPAQADSFYIDLDFDMVIKDRDLKNRSSNCIELKSCGSRNYSKEFYYDQSISLGSTTLSTNCFDQLRHKQSCSIDSNIAVYNKYDFFYYSTLYLNNSRIRSIPSSRTCTIFKDSYPRIVDSNNPLSFCGNCDSYSSFYVVPDAAESLCRYGDYCFSALARQYNFAVTPNENRKERLVSDSSLRMERSYSSLAFNPHIDLVAFHKDNGVFFRSKTFQTEGTTIFDRLSGSITAGNPKITFNTYDTGIKIYALYAEKLQSSPSQTWACKRFPVELNSCKCYGLNISDYSEHPYSCDTNTYAYADIFLPGLSTRNSPPLRKYGGYSQAELDILFGPGVLTAGGSLPVLTNKIIPDQPYGCERSISVSLKNYINSEWLIKPSQFSTNHSDVWVSVSENGDPAAPFVRYIYDGFYFTAYNNPNWKRFFTKVSIDGFKDPLWKDQQKNLFIKDSTVPETITIKLQNPYLEKLTKEQELVLAPPTGNLITGEDLIFGQPVTFGDANITSRGDETSTVGITFTNKPRKQLLAFGINPPRLQGTLRKGFFHPNSGLTLDSKYHGQSPFKDSTIYYDQPLYEDSYSPGMVLVGDLTTPIQNMFNQISQFDKHRKPRLYIQVRGSWYNVAWPNRNGYKHQGYNFVGLPAFFEYVHHKKNSKNIPGLIPIAPKQHILLSFVGNHPLKFDYTTGPITPILFEQFERADKRSIIVPGSRYYFMIPETDPAISISMASIKDIASITTEQAEKITIGSMVVFGDGKKWLYIGPNKNSPDSYIITEHGYLYHNFSDLHIPYSQTNKAGYVYNSRKKTNQKIAIYNSRGEVDINTVLEKELVVKFDKSLSFASTDEKASTIRVFTKFVLQNKPRNGYNMLDPLLLYTSPDIEGAIQQYSLTAYVPTLWLRAETDNYLNSLQKTKWGDVLYYDGEILDSITGLNIDEEYWYPKPTYKNTFYKLIVNNHLQNKHRYKIFVSNNNTTYTIDHNDLVYYNIHQKYNTKYDNKFYSTNLDNYHNYLPFIDINLLSQTTNASIRENLGSLIASSAKPISGVLICNSLHNELPDDHDWGGFIDPNTNDKFWINLPDDIKLVSSFVPKQTIYSSTLRIDDPVYWLNQTNKSIFIDEEKSVNCLKVFNPSNNIKTISSVANNFLPSNMGSKVEIRRPTFYTQPIYCDTDNPEACGNQTCEINNIGSVNLTSEFKIGTLNTLSLKAIPDSVPYIISYDAGNYNPFGSQSITTIKRFEIDPDSWLDTNNSCSANILRPLNIKSSAIDSRYQSELKEVNDHSLLIKNTDDMANEILFRLMHGEKIPINKSMLLREDETLVFKDLVSYSDPKITANNIYDQILYSYDRTVVPNNLLYSSTLSIDGILSVGKTISLSIGTIDIELTIVKEIEDNETIIAVRGTINNTPIYGRIYTEQYVENSLIVTEGSSEPQPSSENDTIVKVGSRTRRASYSWSSFAAHGRSTDNSGWYTYVSGGRLPFTSSNSIGGMAPATTPDSPSCEDISVTTGDTHHPGTYGGSVIFPPYIGYEPQPTISRCTANFDQCKDFQYSYCRRKKTQECASCKDTFIDNDGEDFEYEFSICRNTLTVYGNTYREQHFDPVTPRKEALTLSEGQGRDCGTPASVGIGRGCWGPRACPRCLYIIADVYGWCDVLGYMYGQWRKGGPWTEHCITRRCITNPAVLNNYYHRSSIISLEPYRPLCPTHLCTITYSNYSVSITYPDTRIVLNRYDIYSPPTITQEGTATQCIDTDFNGACPYITINTLPSDFTIQESISSECSPCNQPPIKLDIPRQKQKYATIKEKRKCIIGTFIYGIVNDKPLIHTGFSAEGNMCGNECCFGSGGVTDAAPCLGWPSNMRKQCGGTFEWFGCLGSMKYSVSKPVAWPGDSWFRGGCPALPAGEGTERPLNQIICEFAIPRMIEGPTASKQLEEWKASTDESYSQGGRCLENVHIPEEDIIQGIIPGSCSNIPQYKTYAFKSFKARPVGKTSVEVAEWEVNVAVAYYEYEYIRPKTIQDILKPEGAICSNQITVNPDGDIPELTFPETPQDGGDWDFLGQINKAGQFQCWSLPFPSWFNLPGWYQWWGAEWRKPTINNTFILTDNYIRKDGCTDGLSSYYRYNLNRNDQDWQEPPMPCASADWHCWSTQEVRGPFLSAKTGKTWI